jgi:GntR family transcriptional regulator, transcriptional repressor for pyruvate dehydrogenase complex
MAARKKNAATKPAATKTKPAQTRESRRRAIADSRSCIAIAPTDVVTRPLKTSETVARDVVHDIIAGHLRPGDSLPSETAMLEQYGVSRESLREGLRLLEVQGLITIRRGPGGGPVVGTVDPAHLGRISTLYYHLAGATYRELLDAWLLVEPITAERAARNPDANARLAAMKPYLNDDPHDDTMTLEEFVQVHAGFHGAIASLITNRVLELTLQTMGQIVTHHSVVVGDPRDVRAIIENDHHQLARAIASGHAQRARSLMEQHIASIIEVQFSEIASQLDDFIEWR